MSGTSLVTAVERTKNVLTVTRKPRKKWTCTDPACRHVQYVKTSSRRCEKCGQDTRRIRKTKAKPRESYAEFCRINREIHFVADESCGACGKPPSENRKNDRDHDHKTGLPRGLACPGNNGCNILMPKWMDAAAAQALAQAQPDNKRWPLIAAYLERVEEFYAAHPG